MNKKAILLVISLFVIFCATGSIVVTGKRRPAISSYQVKVYLEEPKEYEVIGLVESSSEVEFSGQAAMDRAIERMKYEAANVGANGILLISTGSNSSGGAMLPIGNMFIYADSESKSVKGKAIYVIKE